MATKKTKKQTTEEKVVATTEPEVVDTTKVEIEEITPDRESASSSEVIKLEDIDGVVPTDETQAEETVEAPEAPDDGQGFPPYAYVSLLTSNNFMYCLVAMLHSYNAVSHGIPMVVMVTPDITEENRAVIRAFGAQALEVPKIELPYDPAKVETYPCFEKINMFRLQGPKKIVCVDADMIFLQNTDELFEANPFACVFDAWINNLNSGLMVIEPNEETYQKMMDIINTKFTEEGKTFWREQGVFNELLPDWPTDESLHLDKIYNYQIKHFLDFKRPREFYSIPRDVKILHVSGHLPKPWVMGNTLSYYAYMGGYTYAAIMEQYVELINGVIGELAEHGIYSNDLKLINLTLDHSVFGQAYPRRFIMQMPDETTTETTTEEAKDGN